MPFRASPIPAPKIVPPASAKAVEKERAAAAVRVAMARVVEAAAVKVAATAADRAGAGMMRNRQSNEQTSAVNAVWLGGNHPERGPYLGWLR